MRKFFEKVDASILLFRYFGYYLQNLADLLGYV